MDYIAIALIIALALILVCFWLRRRTQSFIEFAVIDKRTGKRLRGCRVL